MHIVVLADEDGREQFNAKNKGDNIQLTFTENPFDTAGYSADAFFILKEEVTIEEPGIFSGKPVFINSTVQTLKQLGLPNNFSRINAWPGFLNREIWEVATGDELLIKDIFQKSGWKYIIVEDEPGLISARIISMIINEAYFALGENVSTKDEIDLAMKLGTNYPYGPFEWSRKIGLKNIYVLLEKLSVNDTRYSIAPAIKNELQDKWHSC